MNVSYKKTLHHPSADAAKRAAFQSKIEVYKSEGRPLIYIDEAGFAHDMPRTHGYSVRGERCYGVHNWNPRKRTNAIGAILNEVLISCWLCDCNINSDIFY